MSKPSHFVQRLYHALEKAPRNTIHWTDDGLAFIVVDRDLFVSQILHNYFKYTKFTSFERRLRLHGFRRRSFVSQEVCQRALVMFSHPHFQRDNRALLRLISLPAQGETVANADEELSDIYNSINGLQQQIDLATSKLELLVQYVMESPDDDESDGEFAGDDYLPQLPIDFSIAEVERALVDFDVHRMSM
ncbi:hypothetical protein ACHHYP_07782 [Achlya hypogyna]|uniref:HSF-type DNA-binding domain-containing protein n=1 Tax=Achlya hypogyna TaxID=1202772 RepID=A0A1V9YQE0_ACHHY|nr:hypothetical protein ACHHYP_07782 [Achlya hypogyna]